MGAIRWTPEMNEALVRLCNEGLSARQIGQKMRVSRNSVIGKVNRAGQQIGARLRLPQCSGARGLKKPRKTKAGLNDARINRYVRAVPPPNEVTEYDENSLHVTLNDLEKNQCRWAVNNPPSRGEFLFCGHETKPGDSYCAHHNSRAWRIDE